MRMLEHAGLVPSLRFSYRAGCTPAVSRAGWASGDVRGRGPGMTRHLLVTNDFPPKVGGIQSYLWELWRRLDPESFVVLTASSHPDAPAFDAAQAALGVHIVRVPESILFFPTPTALAQCAVRPRA